MITVDEIRKRARDALPGTVYRQFADSPTIREYTRWGVFEEVFSKDGTVLVTGAAGASSVPRFSFDPAVHRALAEHFSRIDALHIASGDEIASDTVSGHGRLHIFLCISGEREIVLDDLAFGGSKSVTYDVFLRHGSRATVYHYIRSKNPHYVHVRVHGDEDSFLRAVVVARATEAHVHYELFPAEGADLAVNALLVDGRADLVVDGVGAPRAEVSSKTILLSPPGSFLVSRGRLSAPLQSTGASISADVLYLSSGGLAVGVPELSVDDPSVSEARHGVRSIALSPEALFYLQSRGLSPESALHMYIEGILESVVGSRVLGQSWVSDSVTSFVESLLRQSTSEYASDPRDTS